MDLSDFIAAMAILVSLYTAYHSLVWQKSLSQDRTIKDAYISEVIEAKRCFADLTRSMLNDRITREELLNSLRLCSVKLLSVKVVLDKTLKESDVCRDAESLLKSIKWDITQLNEVERCAQSERPIVFETMNKQKILDCSMAYESSLMYVVYKINVVKCKKSA